jgi:hypothetical protein
LLKSVAQGRVVVVPWQANTEHKQRIPAGLEKRREPPSAMVVTYQRNSWYMTIRSGMMFIPVLMVVNKLLRGNVFGIPSEHDIVPMTLFPNPTATEPRDLSGFAGESGLATLSKPESKS